MVSQIIEGTVTAVLAFLVLNNWYGFTQAVSAIGGLYTSGVKTLQGR